MAKYLLDTTALIEHLHGNQEVMSLVMELVDQGHRLGICGVNVAELFSGVSPVYRSPADELVGDLEYYELTNDAAKEAGRYRYQFARRGVTLSTTDSLVAAVAVAEDATLVTRNIRDFPIENLRLLPHG